MFIVPLLIFNLKITDCYNTHCAGTGVVRVDLTDLYDTVNHRNLIQNHPQHKESWDHTITSHKQPLLCRDGFQEKYVALSEEWITAHPVLAPTLLNIYTNDQP